MHDGMKATKLSIYKTLERLLNIIRSKKKKRRKRKEETQRLQGKKKSKDCNHAIRFKVSGLRHGLLL